MPLDIPFYRTLADYSLPICIGNGCRSSPGHDLARAEGRRITSGWPLGTLLRLGPILRIGCLLLFPQQWSKGNTLQYSFRRNETADNLSPRFFFLFFTS